MKKLLLLPIVLLFYLQGFSQVSLQNFFPMGVLDVSLGDTLLNTNAVLKTAGARKIICVKTIAGSTITGFSPITTYLNTQGKIENVVSCFNRPKKPDSPLYFIDTVFYDGQGRMEEFLFRDANRSTYLQCNAIYDDERKVKYTWIAFDRQRASPDTEIIYHDYNKRGQMVHYRRSYGNGKKGYTVLSASVYYNKDGLPDSIRHDDPKIGTYIFKRKQKGQKKEITLQTSTQLYKWVYNPSGQCVYSDWSSRYDMNRSNSKMFTASSSSYEYNADGTLSKVVVKRDGKKFATLSYSYEK
jgi:hypothetical protein